MRAAFAYSINTVAVRLAQEVGTRAVADMAQRFGITTPGQHQSRMALGSSEVRLIDMTRAYAAVGARRRRGDALRHPPGDHRRRHPALPAPGRRDAGAGRALGGAADDRAAPGRGRARHRPRAPSSAGRPPARPAPPRRTRTAGSSAFRAASPPASGWAATTIAPCPASPAAARRPRAFHDLMVRAVANRPVEPFATDAAAPDWEMRGRQRDLVRAARRRSLWSTRTATRSSRRRRRRTTGKPARPTRRRRATRRSRSPSGSTRTGSTGRSAARRPAAVRRRAAAAATSRRAAAAAAAATTD